MKVTTKVGLVGFLLALSSINILKAEARTSQSTIESRLGRIAKVIREKENQAEISLDIDSVEIAGTFINSGNRGVGFLNRAPSFRNGGVSGWRNGGGGAFINRAPSFRNYNNGWRNGGVSGWRNGGGSGWRNGGSFRNGGGGFRNF